MLADSASLKLMCPLLRGMIEHPDTLHPHRSWNVVVHPLSYSWVYNNAYINTSRRSLWLLCSGYCICPVAWSSLLVARDARLFSVAL